MLITGGLLSFLIVVLAVFLQKLFLKIFNSFQVLDIPDNQLKTHIKAVPPSGGIALFFGVLLTSFVSSYFYHFLLMPFLLLGLVDDIFNLRQKFKFLIQFILLLNFVYWSGLNLAWWQWILSLTIINAFNLIDVADGLCGSVALFVAINFAITAFFCGNQLIGYIFVALILNLIGFLWFNKPPAQCYLGDAGSTYLGASFGLLPWLITWPSAEVKFISMLLILAIPLAEVLMLVIIRTYLGIAPYYGSRHHFVHFLQAKSWSLIKVLSFVWLVGLFLLGLNLGLLLGLINPLFLLFLLVLAFPLWLLVIYW